MESLRIEQTVRETLEQNRMLEGCGRVVAAFSGGADSTMLLHLLSRLLPGRVTAAHVNHNLRGAESDRDEQHVRTFCRDHGIPLAVHSAQVAQEAERKGESVEECGRRIRYAFFDSLLEGEGDRIATAHTLSDRAETMLFHLMRGTGVRGLQGIPPVRDRIIRPLIRITREEVEAYCREYGLSFVQDSTNFETLYARNRIRLQVMPVLKEQNPQVLRAMERTAQQMEEAERAMIHFAAAARQESRTAYGYSRKILMTYPKAVTVQLILEELRERACGNSISDEKIQEIFRCLEQGSGAVTVRDPLRVVVEQDNLIFSERTGSPQWEMPFPQEELHLPDGRAFQLTVENVNKLKNRDNNLNSLFHIALDYDKIHFGNVWRNRRNGDKIRPFGRGIHKTLKKFLQEKHVPEYFRDTLLLLADGSEILWVEGFGPSEEAAVESGTRRVLLIREVPSAAATR